MNFKLKYSCQLFAAIDRQKVSSRYLWTQQTCITSCRVGIKDKDKELVGWEGRLGKRTLIQEHPVSFIIPYLDTLHAADRDAVTSSQK